MNISDIPRKKCLADCTHLIFHIEKKLAKKFRDKVKKDRISQRDFFEHAVREYVGK